MATLEESTFQRRPCYRYIRASDRLPAIRDVLNRPDPVARVKLFDPSGSWSWFIAGYDPDTRNAYGVVHGQFKEAGDFSMAELVAFRNGLGLPIERDLYWTPRPISELLD